jgi:hypothetical protein
LLLELGELGDVSGELARFVFVLARCVLDLDGDLNVIEKYSFLEGSWPVNVARNLNLRVTKTTRSMLTYWPAAPFCRTQLSL